MGALGPFEILLITVLIGVFAFVPSLLVGWLASRRGRSGLGFFLLSLLLTPVIGFIVVLLVSDRPKPTAYARVCPFCREGIKTQAIVCPHCQREVGEMSPEETPQARALATHSFKEGKCEWCGARRKWVSDKRHHCKKRPT